MKFHVQVQDKTSLLVDLKPALTLDLPFWFKTQLFAQNTEYIFAGYAAPRPISPQL